MQPDVLTLAGFGEGDGPCGMAGGRGGSIVIHVSRSEKGLIIVQMGRSEGGLIGGSQLSGRRGGEGEM